LRKQAFTLAVCPVPEQVEADGALRRICGHRLDGKHSRRDCSPHVLAVRVLVAKNLWLSVSRRLGVLWIHLLLALSDRRGSRMFYEGSSLVSHEGRIGCCA
jgi:hypothetical protein